MPSRINLFKLETEGPYWLSKAGKREGRGGMTRAEQHRQRLRDGLDRANARHRALALDLQEAIESLQYEDRAWDPAKHPKQPKGAPEGKGGQWAPKTGAGSYAITGYPMPETRQEREARERAESAAGLAAHAEAMAEVEGDERQEAEEDARLVAQEEEQARLIQASETALREQREAREAQILGRPAPWHQPPPPVGADVVGPVQFARRELVRWRERHATLAREYKRRGGGTNMTQAEVALYNQELKKAEEAIEHFEELERNPMQAQALTPTPAPAVPRWRTNAANALAGWRREHATLLEQQRTGSGVADEDELQDQIDQAAERITHFEQMLAAPDPPSVAQTLAPQPLTAERRTELERVIPQRQAELRGHIATHGQDLGRYPNEDVARHRRFLQRRVAQLQHELIGGPPAELPSESMAWAEPPPAPAPQHGGHLTLLEIDLLPLTLGQLEERRTALEGALETLRARGVAGGEVDTAQVQRLRARLQETHAEWQVRPGGGLPHTATRPATPTTGVAPTPAGGLPKVSSGRHRLTAAESKAVQDAVAAPFLARFPDARINVSNYGAEWSIGAHDPATNSKMTYTLNFDTGGVYYGLFVIGAMQRGQGAAKPIQREQFKLWQQMGFKQVKLQANIDVGGYAWARFGWSPTADSWGYLRNRMHDQMDNVVRMVRDGDATMEEGRVEDIEELMDELDDPKDIWSVVDSPIEVTMGGETVTIGKHLLLNANWNGVLKLDDRTAMERFNAYTRGT